MIIELFKIILTSAINWGVHKTLDVKLKCFYCNEEWKQNIGNVQYNDLGCKNCNKQVPQFTNACKQTVNYNGEIGHVISHLKGSHYSYSNALANLFKENKKTGIVFPVISYAKDMNFSDYVLQIEARNYNYMLSKKNSNNCSEIPVIFKIQKVIKPFDSNQIFDNELLSLEFFKRPYSNSHLILPGEEIFEITLQSLSASGDILYENIRIDTIENLKDLQIIKK